jgi:hypothetical protein
MTDQPDLPDGDVEADLPLYQRVRAAIRDIDEQDAATADAARETALAYLAGSGNAVGRPRHRSRWLVAVAAGVVGVLGATALLRTSPPDSDQLVTAEANANQWEMRSAEVAAPMALEPEILRAVVSANEPTDATCTVPVGQQSHGVHLLGGVLVEVITERDTRIVRVLDATSCDELQMMVLDD